MHHYILYPILVMIHLKEYIDILSVLSLAISNDINKALALLYW